MTRDPLVRATDLLRGALAEPGDAGEELPAARDEAIAKLGAALRARAERQRRRRMLATFAIAAGFAAVATAGALIATRDGAKAQTAASTLGRVREPAGAVTAVRGGHAEALGTGSRVAEGTELRTPASAEAHLDFDTGTQVTLGGAARVRLVEQSKHKRFALESGSLFAKVAKLGEGERFVVATPDAEVEVRGTAFRVSIAQPEPACGDGTPTRLAVTEGTVVVRHNGSEARVTAGQKWPSCAEPVAVTPPAEPAVAPPPPPHVAPSPPSAHPATPAAIASSRLAEQNDLFEQAMRARREGRHAAAIATFDKLLAQYPGGPLAEGASAERMRILAASDRARARAAAREYLTRFPSGGARAEAEGLAAGAP